MSRRKYKPKWVVISVQRKEATWYWLNGTLYTDLDEPLRLAFKRMSEAKTFLRIWKKPEDVLLSGYRTSKAWGEPHTEKLPFEKIWPIFEVYARML